MRVDLSGSGRAVCQYRRGGPSVGARRRWLVDSGEGRADRTGARKLSGKDVTDAPELNIWMERFETAHK